MATIKSIEEKAKAYDMAIKKAKYYYDEGKTLEYAIDIVSDIFPELKESDDEGIRNFLIDFIKVCGWTEKKDQGWPLKEECIAWLEKQDGHAKFINGIQVGDKVTRNKDGVLVNLSQLNRVAKKDEKQGKQKPADKVEPKFKIGDFIVNDYCMGRIVEITNDAYLLDTEQGIPFSCHSTRLWDITKDAKDGDVLADGNLPFIFKKIDSMMHSYAYCGISVDSGFKIESEGEFGEWTWAQDIKPATKEQRDQLEKAMADAGYTFDFERKELKKIEQKPITHKYNVGDTIYYGSFGRIVSMVVANVIDNGDGNPMYEDADGSAVFEKDLVEQNPAWSEEDETTKNNISHIIRQYDKISKRENQPCYYVGDCLLWMQNIKDRVQPQPKQEWSEEDENTLEEVISILEYQKGYCSGKWHCVGEACPASKCIDKLKSIRPQLLWKPSDEQMDALESAVSLSQSTTLESLYNELKKL